MEEEEEMDNYFDLGPSATGKWKHYVYLDVEELLIVSLLARHQVHVKCEAVMHKDNEKYTMIALKVLKKDEEKFLQALEELKNKMLLCGHRDYVEQAGALILELKENLRQDLAEKGHVDLPTGGRARIQMV